MSSHVRSIEELEVIFEEVKERLFLANRTQELDDILDKIGVITKRRMGIVENGKILIIGDCPVKEKDLQGIFKHMKIDFNRIQFIDYNVATNYPFMKLKHNPNIQAVLFGPTPHKAKGVGKAGSIISKLESQPDDFPQVIRLINHAGELAITKRTLKKGLEEIKNWLIKFRF